MILQRIKEYIDLKGISISAFEKSIGMSNASFGRSLKNNGAIGTDKLENILRIYQEINPDWLLTGQGNMVRSGSKITLPPPVTEKKGIPLISYHYRRYLPVKREHSLKLRNISPYLYSMRRTF